MKFDLAKACPGCPFLKDSPKAVRLRVGRIIEIHNGLTSWHGGSFSCHNTVDYDDAEIDDDESDDFHCPAPTEKHCAGALGYLANLGSDGPQGVKFMVYGVLNKTYADYGPPERCFASLHDWKATAIDADDGEPVSCETCDAGCLAPAGYMTAGGVQEGTDSADDECSECGAPTCSNCLRESGLCWLCEDEDEEAGE